MDHVIQKNDAINLEGVSCDEIHYGSLWSGEAGWPRQHPSQCGIDGYRTLFTSNHLASDKFPIKVRPYQHVYLMCLIQWVVGQIQA